MTGEDHLVVAFAVAVVIGHDDAPGFAPHLSDAALQMNARPKWRAELLNIAPSPAPDGAPGMLGVQAEKAVVVKEAQQGRRRKLQHALGRRGPDCAAHR